MPGIDGFDVVEVLARHHPHLPVLCMSGYVSQLNADRQVTVPLIHKPFTAEVLREAVVQLIGRSRALQHTARERLDQAADQVATSKLRRTRTEEACAATVDLVAEARALREARANQSGPG